MHGILIISAAVLSGPTKNPRKELCAFGKETAGWMDVQQAGLVPALPA